MGERTDPDEILVQPRPVVSSEPASPSSVVWLLMRSHARTLQSEREESAKRHAAANQRHAAVVISLVDAQHQLRLFLRSNWSRLRDGLGDEADLLTAVATQFDLAIERAGASLWPAEGDVYTLDMQADADAVFRPRPDVERPTVRAVVRPAVRLDGILVRRAQIEVAVAEAKSATEGDETEVNERNP